MKGLVWHGKHDLRLEDVQEPRCDNGEPILEVKYAGICGSDLTIYHGKHTRAKPPTILGHEFVGVVVDCRQLEKQGEFSTRDLAARIVEALDLPRKRIYDLVVKLRAVKEEAENI